MDAGCWWPAGALAAPGGVGTASARVLVDPARASGSGRTQQKTRGGRSPQGEGPRVKGPGEARQGRAEKSLSVSLLGGVGEQPWGRGDGVGLLESEGEARDSQPTEIWGYDLYCGEGGAVAQVRGPEGLRPRTGKDPFSLVQRGWLHPVHPSVWCVAVAWPLCCDGRLCWVGGEGSWRRVY